MRSIATILAVVSLLCLGLVLLDQGGERSAIAAVTCAIVAVAFAVLSLGTRGREPVPQSDEHAIERSSD